MEQTITVQYKTTWRRRTWLFGFLLMFLPVGFTGLQAQTILWTSGFPKINPTPVTVYDTSYVEVAFAVDANSTATTVVFTLPTGIALAGAPIALPGNNTSFLSGTETTITLGTLTLSSVINFKVPVYGNACNPAAGQKIKLEVKSGSTVLTDGTRELDAVFQKPAFNGAFEAVESNYTNKDESQQRTFSLSAINGNLNTTFRLTFTAPKQASLENFKLAGVDIPGNKLLKNAINSGQDTVYTLVFDDKTWLNSTLSSTYGKITSTPVNLTFDAVTLTPCGTKTITANGWYPASSASSPYNVAPATACGTMANSIFTMKMTDIAGVPNFIITSYNSSSMLTDCLDGTTSNTTGYVEYQNNGSADAYNTEVGLGCGGDMLSEYWDLDNIYYQIEDDLRKKVDASQVRVTTFSSTGDRWCAPQCVGKPLTIYVPIADPVSVGKKVKVWAGKIRGIFYDTSLPTNTARTSLFNWLGSGILSTNACGISGVDRSLDGISYQWKPSITGASVSSVSFRKSEVQTLSLPVYGGSEMLNNDTYPMSIDVFVQFPLWLELEPAALLAGTAMQWRKTSNGAIAIGTISNEGNGLYKLNLKGPQAVLETDATLNVIC